jgi:hypothetical protein
VLEPRVYRAAFLPALIALFVVAFSLEGRPSPSTSRLAADAFQTARAFGAPTVRDSLLELAQTFPARRPGSPGDLGVADRVAGEMRAAGFRVTRTRHEGSTVDGRRDLENVIGVRPGLSSREIVVVASRDARDSPGAASLSGTAALIELARVFRSTEQAPGGAPADADRPRLFGRDVRKTLVLVSTSGGSGGGAGIADWARSVDPSQVDGVLVLGDLASVTWHKPWVVPWSDGGGQAPLAWQRTVEAAIRQETGRGPGGSRASAQWIHRAVPLTVSEQGPAAGAGLPAVLLSASGERGPAPNAPISSERFEAFGQGALRAISALDAAGRADAGGQTRDPYAGDTSGILTLRTVLPDWSVRLLVLCLLLPVLAAAFDAYFRARRRGGRIGQRLGWIALLGAPALAGWLWLRFMALVGAVRAPAEPVLPAWIHVGVGGWAALASALLVVAGAWFTARVAIRAAGLAADDPAEGAAGTAVAVAIGVLCLVAWVANPYAAFLLLPAAHGFLLATCSARRLRGPFAWPVLAVALVPPLLVLVYEAVALRIGPLGLAELWLLAIAGGHVTVATALGSVVVAGAAAGAVRVVWARRGTAPEGRPRGPRRGPSIRGPSSYAGPGSLGGTRSALRR